jgi:membrane protease YdiL (CAAX protease family)
VINPFLGPHGLRSGWRVLAFLFLTFCFASITGAIAHWLSPKHITKATGDLIQYGSFLAAILVALWMMAKLDGRPVASYGLGSSNRARNLLAGLAAGFAGVSLLIVLQIAAGAFQPSGAALHGADAIYWATQSAILFLIVGLSEELLTRGYPLLTLSEGIRFWPSAVIVSLLFAAGHLGNRGEDLIGIANAVLVGLVFAYSVWWTGTLWWAIGCHASWDWAETYFYGVPNSGIVPEHHLFSGFTAGPAWLSGGTAGPEGSAIAVVIILLLAAAARWTTPRATPPLPAESAAPESSPTPGGL